MQASTSLPVAYLSLLEPESARLNNDPVNHHEWLIVNKLSLPTANTELRGLASAFGDSLIYRRMIKK